MTGAGTLVERCFELPKYKIPYRGRCVGKSVLCEDWKD